MSRLLVGLVVLVVACSTEFADQSTTTTTESISATTKPSPSITSTTTPVSAGGHLVKLDPLTLEAVPGLDPIPMGADSWNIGSSDGMLLVNFEWDDQTRIIDARTIDITNSKHLSAFQVDGGPHSGLAEDEGTLYTYGQDNGHLVATDIATGQQSTLDEWPSNLWLWDDLHVLSEHRIAALGSEQPDLGGSEFSVFVHDPVSRLTSEFPIGPMERIDEQSAVFDGEYEIPEVDSPGVVWDDNRVLIVYADGPEVIEVDLETGAIENHMIELTSWWDRLWAYWMPTAYAKGPALGTYSSAALSPDGRHLYISGNKAVVATAADGSLTERSEHLGVAIIDTETWQHVESPDLPIQFVLEATGVVMGVDTTSTQPWIDNYYLLSTDASGGFAHRGPFTVTGGACELTPDRRYLLCSEYRTEAIHIRMIDIQTMETNTDRTIGLEDVLHPNAILEDWLPRTDP